MSRPTEQGARYYSPRDLGASLKKVASDIVATEDHSVTSRWYHSDLDVDLYVWIDDNENIIKQQVLLCGQVVEWNVLEGIRTGLVADEENGVGIYGNGVLKYDSSPLKASVWQATDLVKHMKNVESPLRTQIIGNFVDSPDIINLSSDDFLERYGKSAHCETTRGAWAGIITKLSRVFK